MAEQTTDNRQVTGSIPVSSTIVHWCLWNDPGDSDPDFIHLYATSNKYSFDTFVITLKFKGIESSDNNLTISIDNAEVFLSKNPLRGYSLVTLE